MNKKRITLLSLFTFVFVLTFTFTFVVFKDKVSDNNKGSDVKRILNKPAGIQAVTINGEYTSVPFADLIEYYDFKGITCENGTVAVYNKDTNLINFSNINIPDHCSMDFDYGEYSLTIDPNGGYRVSDNDSSIMKASYPFGHVETISERRKIGYTLVGYTLSNTDTGGTSATDLKRTSFTFDKSTKTGTYTQGAANITLKAKWSPNTYSVTLDNQGASTAGTSLVYYQFNTTKTIDSVKCYYYTDKALSTCLTSGHAISVPSRTGYAFGGYYTKTNGGGTQFVNASGTFVNDLYKNTGIAKNTTLYANWNPNQYQLTLKKGTGIASIYYKINGASTYTKVTADVTLNVNYNSDYYFYVEAATGYSYTKCTEASPCSTKMKAEATTQTLDATPNKYTLTLTKGTGISTIYYKVNGASTYTSTNATATLSVTYGTTYYFYGVASTGYTYTACTLAKPCSVKMGTSGSQTLDATINKYNVTLIVKNGSGGSTKTIEYGKSGTFTNVKPTNNFTTTSPTILCNFGASGTISGSTVTISNVKGEQSCMITFKYPNTIYDKILADNPTRPTRPSFANPLSTDNTGTLYSSTESVNISGTATTATTVYYFAGNAQNNWVKFGGFYWRIIRTNHDKSIRLIYAGTSPDTTEGYIGTGTYNSTTGNSMYVGYKYGSAGSLAHNRNNTNDSTIKTTVDTWYKSKLNIYTSYLSKDAVYCNDRTIGTGSYTSTGTTKFTFAASSRLGATSPSPTYNCKTQQDAFAVNNSKAKLTYPIGLMTADEIVYAGGVYSTTGGNSWFYRNNKSVSSDYSHSITGFNNWWTMTPAVWAMNGTKNASMFNAYTVRGLLATTNSNNTSGMVVRPVISLSGSLKVASGNGSSSNPYMLSLQTVRVNFHRNRTSSDTSVASQYFILGESGNRFGYFTDGTPRWKQTGQFGQYDYAGHTLQGWVLTQNATAKNYSVYSGVKDSWLTNVVNKKFDGQTTAGVIDLYAVWSKN